MKSEILLRVAVMMWEERVKQEDARGVFRNVKSTEKVICTRQGSTATATKAKLTIDLLPDRNHLSSQASTLRHAPGHVHLPTSRAESAADRNERTKLSLQLLRTSTST